MESGDDLYQVTNSTNALIYQSSAMRNMDMLLNIIQLRHYYRHHRDQSLRITIGEATFVF